MFNAYDFQNICLLLASGMIIGNYFFTWFYIMITTQVRDNNKFEKLFAKGNFDRAAFHEGLPNKATNSSVAVLVHIFIFFLVPSNFFFLFLFS